MRRIKVLHLRDTYEIGGPGKTMLETFRAIDATRFDLHLGVFQTRYEAGDTPFTVAAKSLGMPVHYLRGYNQYDPRVVRGVVELVKSEQFDLVHAHEVKSDVITYLASKLHRMPIMTTLHGWIGNRRKDRLLIALDKRVLRAFDCVIAVSGKIRDELVAGGVPKDVVRLLHNAIVVDKYRRTGQEGLLTSLIGKPVEHPVITTIGRLSPEKGQADLIEALAILAREGQAFSAIFVGDGPDRERLESRVLELGLEETIHFPGYLSQPERILEETDLMVLPSHTEGLPNAALEALVMEVPVLATRVGGTPEVVTDGATGRLVPPHEPQSLAADIREFLADPGPWKKMATRGRAMVEAQFDFRVRTRRLEAIYLELAGVDAR